MTVWVHWLFTFLLAAGFALVWQRFHTAGNTRQDDWPEALLLLLATASTLAALARQLPLQNVLLAAFVIAVIGGAAQRSARPPAFPSARSLFGPEAGRNFSEHCRGRAVDLGRRHFEFARRGTVDFASVAENQQPTASGSWA